MKWKEINKKYPKATLKLKQWLNLVPETPFTKLDIQFSSFFGMAQERILYDFFDEQDIFIEIDKTTYCNIGDWCFNINTEPPTVSGFNYKTRKKAEQAAFEKAFEILEKRLSE